MNLQFLGSSPLLASGRQYGLWPETGFLEIGPPLSPRVYLPEAGRLVVTTHYKRAPFGGDFDPRSLRSDGRQGARPAARRSARASLRVLDCVLASASVLSSGSWRSPFLDCARFRFYEFSVVLEVMPAEKNRSTSLVARNFWAMREGRPFGVGLIVCIFTYRKEHPYE